jgi:hypothetical protein
MRPRTFATAQFIGAQATPRSDPLLPSSRRLARGLSPSPRGCARPAGEIARAPVEVYTSFSDGLETLNLQGARVLLQELADRA